jgi:hypothetical protein
MGTCLLSRCLETVLVYPPISRPPHSNGSTRHIIVNTVSAVTNITIISIISSRDNVKSFCSKLSLNILIYEIRLKYFHIQFLFHKKTFYVKFEDYKRVFLFTKILAVCYENYAKHTNTLCEQNAKFCVVLKQAAERPAPDA